MFKTNLKLAYRSLIKNKVFSLINVFGLATGLTCCMLLSMYVYKEMSYDAHQKHADRLYQLGTLSTIEGKSQRSGTTPAPMGPAMQQEFPEIQSVTRMLKAFQDDKTLVQYNDNGNLRSFYETNAYLADSNFFQLLTYDFKEGNAATALQQPNSVVLSEEIAEKLFGNSSAVNKIVHINSNTNGEYDFRVTGVFTPSANPSHIDAKMFMSINGGDVGQWVRQITGMVNNNMFYTYVLLKPNADAVALQEKFSAFIQKHAGAELKASGRNREQYLTPVKDIHLYANDERNVTAGGSLNHLYILLSIAAVTLLIACVNFMNLSTARSSKRAVEIGVRKVLGAEKNGLVTQFLFEAVLLAFISYIISVLLTMLLLPLFGKLADKEFFFTLSQYGIFAGAFLIVAIIAGIAAGLYPAFYLSAFKPVKVLKGRFANSLAAVSFRKALVVFQFVISVALIVASVTISNQMNFLKTKDLGFVKDQQVIIPLRTTMSKEIYRSYKDALLNNQGIRAAGASTYYPGIKNETDWLLYKQGTPKDQTKTVYINRVDNSYLQTLNIQPVAGRLFSPEFPADTNQRIIINEQAVKQFGFASAQDAIGKNIAADFGEEVLFNIVGVVKDFHFKDLRANIESYGFLLRNQPYFNYLIAHVKGNDMQSALAYMSSSWKKLNPNEPFEFSFLDEDFQRNYSAEDRLAAIIRYFTLTAIFISCLGLFGLTTFSVEQRRREIGIRKVLGANTAGLVGLLSKDFLKLVVLSFFIASPLAWFFVNNWLQSFAYRAPFSVWILVIAWSAALIIAFLTISIQAMKAALSNPVRNLRTE